LAIKNRPIAKIYYFLANSQKTGIFNFRAGVAHSWNDRAQVLFADLGRKANLEHIEMPESLRPKYRHFTRAKRGKLRKADCNYRFSSLELSMYDFVNHLKNQAYL
jgi:ADP-L-glycero-D-manno-heptose 6-epimerase